MIFLRGMLSTGIYMTVAELKHVIPSVRVAYNTAINVILVATNDITGETLNYINIVSEGMRNWQPLRQTQKNE